MDCCSFCCADEDKADVVEERMCPKIGLSDEDLLDYMSDDDIPRDSTGNQDGEIINHVTSLYSQTKTREAEMKISRQPSYTPVSRQPSNSPTSRQVSNSFASQQLSDPPTSRQLPNSPTSRQLPNSPTSQELALRKQLATSQQVTTSPSLLKTASRDMSPSTRNLPPDSASFSVKDPTLQRKSSAKLILSKNSLTDKHIPKKPFSSKYKSPEDLKNAYAPPLARERHGSRGLLEMSPEEKEDEKKRLQALVKQFARESVMGFDVILLNTNSGQRENVNFKMNRYLTQMEFGGAENLLECCEIEMDKITGIYKSQDLPKISVALSENENNLAVGLTTSLENPSVVILIFKDRKERDKFYTCMKILRLSVDIARKK